MREKSERVSSNPRAELKVEKMEEISYLEDLRWARHTLRIKYYFPHLRYGKPNYKSDAKLPYGWKYCVNNNKTYYKVKRSALFRVSLTLLLSGC